MKRKISIILMAFLIILVGKAEASTLIQKMGDRYISSAVQEVN